MKAELAAVGPKNGDNGVNFAVLHVKVIQRPERLPAQGMIVAATDSLNHAEVKIPVTVVGD